MSKRATLPGLSALCAFAMISSVAATAMAQQVPVRVIQGTDGTLYAVQGSNSWTLVPDQASDSDVAALNPSGEIDGTFPNELFVTHAPAPVPVRVLQGSDGVLYTVQGSTSWTLVPDQTGMVGCWLASGNAQDVIGGNNGMLMSGTGFAPGIVGQAFSFNAKGQYVKIPRSPKLDPGGAVSIVFWMKADKANPLNACCQGFVTTDFYGVEWEAGGIGFFVSSDGGSWHISGGYPVPAGEWHHVAGVFDGTALSLYVDGVRRENLAWSGAIFPMPSDGFLAFGSEDGRPVSCPGCVGNRYFNGLIGDVLLYNRALTAAEVTQIFNARS